MNVYAKRWYDLDQFIGICFNEDMDEMYSGHGYRDCAKNAATEFFRTQRRVQVEQVREELRRLLRDTKSEEELKTAVFAMGCRWNFTPWRAWLESVLNQIDAFLGSDAKLIPPDAVPGRDYNLRRVNLKPAIRPAPLRAALRQTQLRLGIRPVAMQLTVIDDSKGGQQKVWLCEAICPSWGKPVTLNIPDAVGVHHIHCPHCKKKILYKVEAGQTGPRITAVTDDPYLR